MQTLDFFLPTTVLLFAADPSGGHGATNLLNDIALCVIVAAVLKKIRQLCPHAKAIVTADSPQGALHLYERGADFVFIPRLHSAAQIAQVIESALREGLENARNEQIDHLSMRNEVLA